MRKNFEEIDMTHIQEYVKQVKINMQVKNLAIISILIILLVQLVVLPIIKILN
tara:strand:+ start:1954 stop:2112 length:159 start_codon:yes stop_codon:yes gene_type:complete